MLVKASVGRRQTMRKERKKKTSHKLLRTQQKLIRQVSTDKKPESREQSDHDEESVFFFFVSFIVEAETERERGTKCTYDLVWYGVRRREEKVKIEGCDVVIYSSPVLTLNKFFSLGEGGRGKNNNVSESEKNSLARVLIMTD